MSAIELRGVRKTYGGTVALDGLDLSVADGEFFCLLGPSGAGKTTTLKTIAGLVRPESGRVEIGGVDVSQVEPYDRGVAMCFESYALYPHYSVFDNIASPLRSPRHRMPADEVRRRVTRYADLLGIGHLLDRAVGELSNGQRQRVALGRVMVRPAEAFLLDEPLSHLDAKLRQAMRAELKTIGAVDRTTTLYVTHDYVEALALGDRIGVIRDGRVVQVGTGEEIWRDPVDMFVARSFGKPRINLVSGAVLDGGRFRGEDGGLDVSLARRVAHSGRALLGIRPRDITLANGSPPPDDNGPDGVSVVRGRVDVVEVLGRNSEVTVAVGENASSPCRLSLVVPREDATELRAGDGVQLRLPDDRLLLFDADGRRITS